MILADDTEFIRYDEFDECVVGVCIRFGQLPIITYDYAKVIDKLMSYDMSYDEAVEYFEYNTLGTWAGDSTPAFLMRDEETLAELKELYNNTEI